MKFFWQKYLYQFETEIGSYKDGTLQEFRAIHGQFSPFAIEVEGGVYSDGNTGLGLNSLTSRFYHYNVLKWWGTKVLRKEIKNRRGHSAYEYQIK